MIRTLASLLVLSLSASAFAQNTAPKPVPPPHSVPQQRAELPSARAEGMTLVNPGPRFVFNPDVLDAYIRKNMADWNIPGLAIAIVKDGKTIYMQGFGTKAVGKAEPVDSN